MNRKPTAFTFVEVIAVLVIMALLAAAVAVSARGILGAGDLQEACDRLVNTDLLTRQYAIRQNRDARLVLDLESNTLSRIDASNPDTGTAPTRLPKNTRIEQLFTPNGVIASGQAELTCSAMGHTPTYAVSISDPAQTRTETHRWLVVAGLTGQITKVDDDRTIEALFEVLSRR